MTSRDLLLWEVGYIYLLLQLQRDGVVMKHKMFTVYDSKAEVYMRPFFARADGEATRMFAASVADPNHQFGSNPADYTLFAIGEYDDDSARFTQYEVFTNLGNGVRFLKKEIVNG